MHILLCYSKTTALDLKMWIHMMAGEHQLEVREVACESDGFEKVLSDKAADESLAAIVGMDNAGKAVLQVQYMVGVNGQQAGPFDWNQLQQLVQQGQLTQQTYVWKQGMANWEFAGNVQELLTLFTNTIPQMPSMPPTMPGM